MIKRCSQACLRLLLLGCLASTGYAQSLSLAQVKEKMEAARAGVEDVQAEARFSFRLSVKILPYSDTLNGTYFFKKPDRHRLDFPDAPSYLKSIPSMFSWKLPSAEKYDAVVTGPSEDGNGQPIYQLLFTSRNPSSKTSTITVLIDARKWRVISQDTLYRDGGSVLLAFAHHDDHGLPLLQKVTGLIDIPSYSLKGTAAIDLSRHKINQGLEEAIFNDE